MDGLVPSPGHPMSLTSAQRLARRLNPMIPTFQGLFRCSGSSRVPRPWSSVPSVGEVTCGRVYALPLLLLSFNFRRAPMLCSGEASAVTEERCLEAASHL